MKTPRRSSPGIAALAFFALSSLLASEAVAAPTEAESTLVVFNNSLPASADLAGYYAKKRGIPFTHLIGLDLPMSETIERADYDRLIAEPLRKAFAEKDWWRLGTTDSPVVSGWNSSQTASSGASGESRALAVIENKIRFVVLMHGVPLRIAQTANYPGDIPSGSPPVSGVNAAAVDSELACLGLFTKSISGALKNPYFRSYKNFAEAGLPGVMIVCRLDAPTPQIVRRMIDDSLAAEQRGLWGMALIDSRGLLKRGPGGARGEGTELIGSFEEGDAWLNRAGADARRHGIPVIQDDSPGLFPEDYPFGNGTVAQYYGWYSEKIEGALAREDFRFAPGAVACHIHSFSAETLRDLRKGWVGPLLNHGAAASMGAVFEPYLALTPNLDIFEEHLRAGYSFGESAYASLRALSWMITVVGDPLYTPYKLLRDEPVPAEAAEWEAYRKGALAWFGPSRAEGEKELIQSGRSLRSGIIFEGLGLLQVESGDWAKAIASFEEARQNYHEPDGIVRTALHEAGALRQLNRQKEANRLIEKMLREHPGARGLSLLKAMQQG